MAKYKPTLLQKLIKFSRRYSFWLFGAVVSAVVVTLVPRPVNWAADQVEDAFRGSPGSRIVAESDPHSYSFSIAGSRVEGESTNPFEETDKYFARIEVCQEGGIEGLAIVVNCYLTVKPKGSLTISNSENSTTAIYEDGTIAPFCCVFIDDSTPARLSGKRLPPGAETRYSYSKGSEVHILFVIPEVDRRLALDAISFSPGAGAASVLFPIRGNLKSQVLSREYVEARLDDPKMQQMISQGVQMREALKLLQGSK